MAVIRPFRALRYGPDVGRVLPMLVSPPGADRCYPRTGLDGLHPYNILRLVRGRFDPANAEHERPYVATRAFLHDWKQRGILVRDPEPGFYLHEQEFTRRGQTLLHRGVVGHVHLEPLGKRHIFPHERTLRGPKPDLLDQLRALETNLSLTMALMDDPGRGFADLLASLAPVAEPLADVVDGNGVRNRVARVIDPDAHRAIERAVAGQALVIADGHHRYEIALAHQRERRREAAWRGVQPFDFVMMLVVPTQDADRSVLPAHRVLRQLPQGWRPLLDRQLPRYFAPRELPDADALDAFLGRGRLPRFGLALDDRLLGLTLRRSRRVATVIQREPQAWRMLEVAIARAVLMREVLGVSPDVYADKTHTLFPTSTAEVLAAVRGGGYQLGILMRPTPAPLVTSVARSGHVMPPKSTHFYPKPIKGLVMNSLKGF